MQKQYEDATMTNMERVNKVTAIWSEVTDHVAKEMFKAMNDREKDRNELNPILVMADSGARGSEAQIRQLAGMRGLMAKPIGRNYRNADCRQLPRRLERFAILYLDARRA